MDDTAHRRDRHRARDQFLRLRRPRLSDKPLTADELEAALRAIGAERYHNRHPFHKLLHGGRLTRGQIQAWALNRFYYQRSIPIKDASLMARLPTSELRRMWRSRLVDHDGDGTAPGGIERSLDPELLASTVMVFIMGLMHMETLLPHRVGDSEWNGFVQDRVRALMAMR